MKPIEEMTDREKLDQCREITELIWTWLCQNPILALLPSVERLMKLTHKEIEQ